MINPSIVLWWRRIRWGRREFDMLEYKMWVLEVKNGGCGKGNSVYVYEVEGTVVQLIFWNNRTIGNAGGFSQCIEIWCKASPRFYCTKVDGKSCDTQVPPKHPDFFWYHRWALQLQEEVAKFTACLGERNNREWTAQPQQIFFKTWGQVLLNQTWVHWLTCNKANLLTLTCCEVFTVKCQRRSLGHLILKKPKLLMSFRKAFLKAR